MLRSSRVQTTAMPRTKVIASGPNFDPHASETILACHGTIAEQKCEAHYDDRSEASSDDAFDKGRIKFPGGKLYGREEESRSLREVYDSVAGSVAVKRDKRASLNRVVEETAPVGAGEAANDDSDPTTTSRLSTTTARVVFLSGLSGTGKSALVEELVKEVSSSARHSHHRHGRIDAAEATTTTAGEADTAARRRRHRRPLFGAGKFEQYGETAPFSAISDSLVMYANDLLDDTNNSSDDDDSGDAAEKELGRVRTALGECGLGPTDDDGDVLIGMFPPLAPLLARDGQDRGDDAGSTMSTATSQSSGGLDMNRLKNIFANFVMALTRGRPVIMSVDDLQWADEASLEIITALLLNKSLQNFLFIGCYRSNEVNGDDHPFGKRMAEIEDGLQDGAVQRMELAGLLPEDIARFISDSTEREIDDVQPIVEVVYKKTLGNIFFVMQALEELVRRNIVYYDIICYEWQWNLDGSNQVELENFVSNDVVGMIKSKIGDLTTGCQRALAMMAYTQNTLSPATVWSLMRADDVAHTVVFADVLKVLNEAAGEGLLLKTNSHEYTFAHDLIQEALYSSVPTGDEQDQLKVQIANVLVGDKSSVDVEEWMLFVAAKHLNSVPRSLHNVEALESLAALNLRVANLAMSKASTGQAIELLRSSAACQDSNTRWANFYEFTLDLFDRLIDTEFLLGNYDRAEAAIEEVLKNTTSLRDKCTAHLNLIHIAAMKENRNYEAGVKKGLELLKEYGQHIPLCPSKKKLLLEQVKLKRVRGNRSLIQLVDMPLMPDDSVIKLFELTVKYEYMGSVSPSLSTLIMYRALKISFSQGICWDLALLALSYAVFMNKSDEPKAANLYCSLAANLREKFPDHLTGGDYVQFQFRLLSCSKIRHPFAEDIGSFPDLHQKALSNGLGGIGMACGLIYANCYFAAGLPLNSLLEAKLILYKQRAVQMNQDSFCLMFGVTRQFLLNLLGKSDGNPAVFDGAVFNEEKTLSGLEGNSKTMALRDVSTFRLQLAYIFNDEAVMVEMLERLKVYPLADLSVARGFLRDTFVGLAALLFGREKKNKEYLDLGRRVMKHFKKLVQAGGAANALPPYLCAKAVLKPSRESYDKAIKACSDAGMTNLEAMMCERCGELMKQLEDEVSMKDYFAKALFLYYDWGAFAKVDQMKQQYDFLSSLNRTAPTSISSYYHAVSTGSRGDNALSTGSRGDNALPTGSRGDKAQEISMNFGR